jgi:hypothetical protein
MTAVAERKRLLRVLELAGPAGVGKSTVSRALLRRSSGVPAAIWGQPRLSLLATGVHLGPTLARCWRESGSLLWNESRYLVRLSALHRSLTQQHPAKQLMIFDEGPVFALAWLRGFGHESLRGASFDWWWHGTLKQWSCMVDAVVVLDAPDSVLAQRIRARPEWHEIKHSPDEYIVRWMERFRSALDWVLAGMMEHGQTVVVRIRTEQEDAKSLSERVAAALSVPFDN